jgi:hypothetical protein
MSEHTPGPWEVCHAGTGKNGKLEIDEYYISIPGADVAICADIIDPATGKISEANARLIAAAPDLLAMLSRNIERTYNSFEPDNQSKIYHDMLALRAKATGQN